MLDARAHRLHPKLLRCNHLRQTTAYARSRAAASSNPPNRARGRYRAVTVSPEPSIELASIFSFSPKFSHALW